MLQRKVVVLCQQREPQDAQVVVLTVKRIAYSVDVQLSWTRDTLAGYALTNLWRQFWRSVNPVQMIGDLL